MKLVIAEKPSVAMAIAKALNVSGGRKDGYIENGEYLITWCVGHLIAMAYPQEYNEKYAKWKYEDLPIIPEEFQYAVYGDKQKQFKVVKSLMNRKDVELVINACDAGREGELIFHLVYQQAHCKKPVKRLWISSMEESAICEGFANLKEGGNYENLRNSALCRMWADWLVGINATRLFSLLYNKTLNIGRVQTPTLALLCERQEEIDYFKKEKYFTVAIGCDGIKADSQRIDKEDTADKMITACENSQAVCTYVNREKKTEKPLKLFDLTSLQRASNKIFGYTAKQTLDYAQSLYEKKLITYPRTDSRYLTDDMVDTALSIIQTALQTEPFDKCVPFAPDITRLINNAKVSDHHAIIPTQELAEVNFRELPQSERNILNLIICRLLIASAEPFIYETVTTVFECGGYEFTAKSKEIISAGFTEIEKLILPKAADESNIIPQLQSKYTQGQVLDNVKAAKETKYTKPPKAYTEDTLLAAMETAGAVKDKKDVERKGLGTPATRATIIEKLVQTGFAERKGKQLIPTDKGVTLISVLPDNLISADMTAEWETRLSDIANGNAKAKDFMQDIENMVTALVEQYRKFNKGGGVNE